MYAIRCDNGFELIDIGRQPTILGKGFERRFGRIGEIVGDEIQQPQSAGFRLIEPIPLSRPFQPLPARIVQPQKLERADKIHGGEISAQLPDARSDPLYGASSNLPHISARQGLFVTECLVGVVSRFVDRNYQTHFVKRCPHLIDGCMQTHFDRPRTIPGGTERVEHIVSAVRPMDDVGCFAGRHKRIVAGKQIGISTNRSLRQSQLSIFCRGLHFLCGRHRIRFTRFSGNAIAIIRAIKCYTLVKNLAMCDVHATL
jgi:hypothetical protein